MLGFFQFPLLGIFPCIGCSKRGQLRQDGLSFNSLYLGFFLASCKRELRERFQDLKNRYDKLPIPSEEGPEIRTLMEFIRELLADDSKI